MDLFGAKEPGFDAENTSLYDVRTNDLTEMNALVAQLFDNRLACTVNYEDGTTATQYLSIHAEYRIDEKYHEDKDDDEEDRWDLRFTCVLE